MRNSNKIIARSLIIIKVVFRRVKEDSDYGIIYYGFKLRPVKGCW